VVRCYARNEETSDIVPAIGIQESTLRNIQVYAMLLKKSRYARDTPSSATRKLKTGPEILETAETFLSTWI
jgi:hypothetical protein